jgi:biotin transport system substrate-specific component
MELARTERAQAQRLAMAPAAAALALGLATALSAFVRLPLPFTPVPLTMQTFFVLLSGAMLGAGGGAASQLVGLGLLWASPQLFSAVAAPGGLFGPTGGYMLSFLPAAWLVGSLRGQGGTVRLMGAMLAATALIYLFGTLQLVLLTGMGARAAIWAGVLPFLPGDALKIGVAAAIGSAAGPWLRRS